MLIESENRKDEGMALVRNVLEVFDELGLPRHESALGAKELLGR